MNLKWQKKLKMLEKLILRFQIPMAMSNIYRNSNKNILSMNWVQRMTPKSIKKTKQIRILYSATTQMDSIPIIKTTILKSKLITTEQNQ